jgi:ubiquitin-conjugating enzyme E2 G1
MSSSTRTTTATSSSSSSSSSPTKATSASQSAQYGAILLRNQLREILKNPIDGFSIGLEDDSNIYEWRIMMEGPEGTSFEGGYFPLQLSFPQDYPNKPPVARFLTPHFWHPNVYKDGTVCISILHEAKHDEMNEQEKMSEKWRPILGVEAVLVSILSMLSDPNFDSPANIDASVELRNDPKTYRTRVRKLVRDSLDAL